MPVAAKITPVLRYRDPRAAAQWLCRAFGFSEHETVRGADGEVTYVLLQLGPNFVLVLPVADLGLDELLVQPQAVGGANTQVCYVTVADARAHRVQAERAGAKVEIEPQDDGLGGQFYSCRDLEGHLWSFGTRAYGAAEADGADEAAGGPAPSRRGSGVGLLVRSIAVVAAMAVTAAGGWMAHRTYSGAAPVAVVMKAEPQLAQLAEARKRLAAAEDAAKDAEAKLTGQQATVDEVRRALQQAQAELTAERRRQGEADAALAASKGAAAELEKNKLSAQAELAAARERIAQEKALAKAAADRVAALQAQIDKLQQDRTAEREDLGKAKAALLGAQAQLKALREAKAEPKVEPKAETKAETKAEPTSPSPAAGPGEQEAEKSPAAHPPDTKKAATAEVVTGTIKVPDLPQAKADGPKGACAAAVLGRRRAPGSWVARLCQGAEGTPEPARCFDEVMSGKVSWGGGSSWTANYALALCAGSHNARKTIDCFSEKVVAEEPWQAAIKGCRGN